MIRSLESRGALRQAGSRFVDPRQKDRFPKKKYSFAKIAIDQSGLGQPGANHHHTAGKVSNRTAIAVLMEKFK